MTRHCPGNAAHHWDISIVNAVETGVCRYCKAVREFDVDKTRFKKFGTEPLAPRKLATLVRTKR